MKKAYEAPSAQITEFSAVEDILLASDIIIDVEDLF